MKHAKNTIRNASALLLAAALIAGACSSNDSNNSNISENATTTSQPSATTSTMSAAPTHSDLPENYVVVPFTAANGTGTISVSGDSSPVAEWFANQPGEVSLDLADADVEDKRSVVEELVNFWFFQDRNSGDEPPTIFESPIGEITDSVGTSYVVEAQSLPQAPGTETTTTTTSTTTTSTTTTASSVPSDDPETSVSPTTTSTTTTMSTTTTTTSVVESPVVLQVQVLNGSGVAGAAGRLTDKLSRADYVVLPPDNAPQRYSSSAAYYQDGWQDKAEEILQTADIEEIEEVTAMPQQFATEEAAVVVLLGTDTAPAVVREQAGLRPKPRFDVALPLPDDVPRDRYVPGLSNIQIYSRVNDEREYMGQLIHTLQGWIGQVGNYAPDYIFGVIPSQRESREDLETVYRVIEEIFTELGFTPQNVCGAPAGYSFTDLLQPTREWNESTRTYSGDAIFTTDRLIELHGGERINPEANLDFYINQAVQTAYDALRISELAAETETMQLILCRALLAPSGEVPELANSLWYASLTPGIQPRESLLSQGTYHLKEISRNGNKAWIWICHPTLGARGIGLHWREAGYRAEVHGDFDLSGCQAAYEAGGYTSDVADEEVIKFSFGERVFAADNLLGFPRG